MKTIKIGKNELMNKLAEGLKYAGATDWDIYIDVDGNIDIRNNAHPNQNWYEIIDLYNCEYEGTDFDNPDECRELAEWLVDEDMDIDDIEIYTDDPNNPIVIASVEIVD
jgi:hypothetical protein